MVVEQGKPGTPLQYQASSPDEEALVKAAADIGIVLTAQTAHTKTIDVCGELQEITVHAEFPFDSTRKRMSLIIETGGRY